MPLDQIDIDKVDLSTRKEKEMSFVDHLEEFRWTLIRSITGVAIAAVAVFIFKGFFIGKILMGPSKSDFIGYQFICTLLKPFNICFSNEIVIQNIKMSGQFIAHFQISFITAFIIAFPWIFRQLWKFIQLVYYLDIL